MHAAERTRDRCGRFADAIRLWLSAVSDLTWGMQMKSMAAVLSLFAGIACCNAMAVTLGQSDTFQDGSTEGWATGTGSSTPPVNVAANGPGGATDKYLLLTASGVFGPGGRLVAFSGPGWDGDYVAAGITGIRMQVNNLGSTDLSLRLLFNSTSATSAFSTDAISVLAGSGWTTIRFSVNPGALTGPADVMSGVADWRLYHSVAAGPPPTGAFIAASLGVDNVTAVPEPAAWLTLVAGLAMLAFVARPRAAFAPA